MNWARGNVEVTNDTADKYRYFDCTAEDELLYSCVERTVDIDLPTEINFIMRRDEALCDVMNLVRCQTEWLSNDVSLVFRLHFRENDGRHCVRRRVFDNSPSKRKFIGERAKTAARQFNRPIYCC